MLLGLDGILSKDGGRQLQFELHLTSVRFFFFKFSLLSPLPINTFPIFLAKTVLFWQISIQKCKNGISVDEKDTFCDETLLFRQIFIQVSAENQCFSRCLLYFKLAFLTKHSPTGRPSDCYLWFH